jgi:hypothetical protein
MVIATGVPYVKKAEDFFYHPELIGLIIDRRVREGWSFLKKRVQ